MTRLPAILHVLAGLLALYLLAPFVAGLMQMGRADWAGADGLALLRASELSVASATLATALVALGAVPLGYLLARRSGIAWALLGFVVQLPLALPPLASGILLLFLLGYASPIGQLTGGVLTDSFGGIVIAEAFVSAPFLIIAARSAFAAVDPLLEDVAASLGHKPAAVFRHVGLSLAWRAILAGALLTWLRAFGEFGATVMVAYHPYTLPVFTYVAFGSQGLPAMLPVLLPTLLAAVAVMGLSQAALSPRRKAMAGAGPLVALAPQQRPPGPSNGRTLNLSARRHLEGFDLAVDWQTDAKRLAILGASGSGKSLTLRVIAGLGEHDGSRVVFGDDDLGRLPAAARCIAYVPQNYGLLPNLAVAEQVRFAADSDVALARHWTARLGLTGLDARRPHELSLGQQQRVALARALSRPGAHLLLLDEPFSALDTPLRIRLRDEMLVLQREINATTILVTHDPAEAMLLADELLLLDAGRVLQAGPVNQIFRRPTSEAAARLLGAEVIGHGRAVDHAWIDIGQGLDLRVTGPALAPGQQVGWAVRPYQVRLGQDGPYPATVLRRGPVLDGQRRVEVQLGTTVLTLVAEPSCPAEGTCRATIDPDAVQVWPSKE